MPIMGKLRQAGSFLSDPRWWPFYFQRRFMSSAARGRITRWAARFRPGPLADADTVGLQDLHERGIFHLGRILTEAQATEIREYFRGKSVKDTYRPEQGYFLPESDQRHPHSHTAHHDARDIVMAPHLFPVVNSPAVLSVVSRYLGCRPTLGSMSAWWSYPTGIGAQHAEYFHRDVDDWKFVKLFIYLSDVGLENGPHVYVSCSTSSERLRRIARFEDAEVVTAFGDKNVLTLTGRAGEGFLEDTFGLHKGQPLQHGMRLMFSATYCMFALPYSPVAPVASYGEVAQQHRIEVDPWTNRLYVRG